MSSVFIVLVLRLSTHARNSTAMEDVQAVLR